MFIAMVIIGFAAFLQLGNPALFGLVALVIAAELGIVLVLARLGHPIAPAVEFRVVLATWPVGFVVLGMAGWAANDYHGEVVALIGFLLASLVALVESFPVAIAWAALAAAALTLGSALGAHVTPETLVTSAAVLVGTAFGDRTRVIVEVFLGDRRRLVQETTRVVANADPFATAKRLLAPLARFTPVRNPSLIWFTRDGRSVFLAVDGKDLPPALTAGANLPDERNAYLRQKAVEGPWITGWAVRQGDSGYTRSVASLGITAGAYVPLLYEGRLLGLLAAGLADSGGGHSAIAEYMPILADVADAAAAALGPALAATEERSTATLAIDEILSAGRFWPVFQPVRRLNDDRVVGFEALTRFDAPITTQRLFIQAGLVGRMRDLEIATLRAAVKAARDLPVGHWLSVNSSPGLLADTDALASILQPMREPVVIELSEHEAITDYAPIGRALALLGPNRQLAVDDAGAGFASLRHILEVRPAYVKLDLGLVQGVGADLTRSALVAGFVHFAREARFELIAEGIETQEDRDELRRLGVSLGQGYLLGRPVRVQDIGVGSGLVARRPRVVTRRAVPRLWQSSKVRPARSSDQRGS
jgi:EAL domain-containing protein (putative c-di-GMP-specific phosphodiesterase class I)